MATPAWFRIATHSDAPAFYDAGPLSSWKSVSMGRRPDFPAAGMFPGFDPGSALYQAALAAAAEARQPTCQLDASSPSMESPPTTRPEQDLGHVVWHEGIDEASGRAYYFNRQTQESQWEVCVYGHVRKRVRVQPFGALLSFRNKGAPA